MCWFGVRPKVVGRKQPRPTDELWSGSSDPGSTSDATSAVTVDPSVWSVFGWRPDGWKKNHRCLRSECRSKSLHCFARYSRDARDGGSLVGRKHDRVRRRTTGKYSTTGQGMVDAVADDQRTDRNLDADMGVRVTSQSTPQPSFPEREADAKALASRAQETPLECIDEGDHVGLMRKRKGEVELKQISTPSA